MTTARTPTRCLWIVAALAMVLLAGSRAEAAVKRGAYAPEIDTQSVLNAKSFSLRALRGRMVLLEFFGTDCPHCRKAVGRMNALHARHRGKLSVVGVTPDAHDKLVRFRKAFGAKHPLAVVPLDVLREYGVVEYPTGLLISPNGRVLWRGRLERLTDRVLAVYLERVNALPGLPLGYEPVGAVLAQGRYGEAYKRLEGSRQCRGISRERCRFVLGALDWIDWFVKSTKDAIATDLERGRWYSAWRGYDELAKAFPDTERGAQASSERAALLAHAERGPEIRAARALYDARRKGRGLSKAEAAKLIEPLVGTHAGTKAGEEATVLLRMLRVK